MSQGALSTPDGSGLAVRNGINDALARLATGAAGNARPADIATYEIWIETDSPGGGVVSVWRFDGTTDILLGTLNTTTHKFSPISVTTTKGDLIKRGASADAPFPVGNKFELLRVNAAGDDLEYAPPGFMKLSADIIPANAASIIISSIPAAVKHLQLDFELLPVTNAVQLLVQIYRAGVLDTAAKYDQSAFVCHSGGVADSVAANGTSWLLGYSTDAISNSATTGGLRGTLLFPDLQSGLYPRCLWDATADLSPYVCNRSAGNGRNTTSGGPIDGIKLFFNSGNISTGRVSVLGSQAGA